MSALPTPAALIPILDTLTPEAMWARYDALCEARPELRATRFILRTRDAQMSWMHAVGVQADAGLGRLVPALPPPQLRALVAAPEPEIFLWTGITDLSLILWLYRQHRRGATPQRVRVLDFGCGCARLLRFMRADNPHWDASGADVHPELAAWSAQALPGTRVLHNAPAPPLDLPDTSFDLVYSLSVFSHLPEAAAARWLAELARVLRPGGVLVATTHGLRALDTIARSAVHQSMFSMSAAEAVTLHAELGARGFVHRPYPAATQAVARAGEDYGNGFVDAAYVDAHWTAPHFERCAFLPGGLRSWQDVVVLRRR